MKPILLDTVGLIALWNRNDQWHDSAKNAFDKLTGTGCDFVSTSPILLECGNASARQPFRQEVILLRKKLESFGLLIFPTDDDWQNAWRQYENGEADQAGIVDCLTFAIMRRLELPQAFTNDHHFHSAGIETLF